PLLSPTVEDRRHVSASDEFAVMHGLYWCVVNLAEERPVVLLIDDVQWADDPSLRFLIYLAQRVEDLPVALVAAVRTGDPGAESELVTRLSSASRVPALRPTELSPAAVRELLSGCPTAISDEF